MSGCRRFGASLDGGAADLQWIINAYLLPLSTLLLIGGRGGGDHFGAHAFS
jgi:hypothetical protein